MNHRVASAGKTVEYRLSNQLTPDVKNMIGITGDPTRADYGFGVGLAVRTTAGIVRMRAAYASTRRDRGRLSLRVDCELIPHAAGVLYSPRRPPTRYSRIEEKGQPMPSLKVSMLDAFGDFRTSGLARPAAEKFAGAWLACFLVMARGNIFAAFTFEHASLASICGIVSAAVTVGLLVQMDRTTDSVSRQATISAVATFVGDIFAHPSHFPPQWAEPTITAAVSAGIAIALWYAKRWAKSSS